MKLSILLGGLVISACVGAYLPADAATNVALTSDGASFVSASSYIDAAGPNLATMRSDPISASPTPWYPDGDTRYIFGSGDADQNYEIKLGAAQLLTEFTTSFSTVDRAVSGPFTVETSLDGVSFTPVVGLGSSTVSNGFGTDSLTATDGVLADYISYSFGPSSTQYGTFGGSGIINVTAISAAPEPSTWVLLLAGIGGIGLMLRRARKTMGFQLRDAFVV